ncbi:MAG: hypothetical protein LAO24_03700 [Acidobacteriia bacterium]|nr:hypothetical protein [Terriglobia bacterium]
MKSCETKFNEALATLKAKTSASTYAQVVEKYSKLPNIEAKLNCVEEALKEAVKESDPLGLGNIDEAKRDFPALFGVEPLTATNKESKPVVQKHNGAVENFVEGSPLNEGRSTPITETTDRKDNIFAKGDAVLVEGMFNRGEITAEQRRVLLGEKPAAYANLNDKQKKEYDEARMFGISEADSWRTVYLPHLERNTKASTIHGYKKIWEGHFAAAFAGLNLKDYQTHHATRFLTALAERRLGVRTIAHIRSLASGMFRHALRLKRIQVNPWRDAGSLTAAKKPEATQAYTLEQAEAISNALTDCPPAQLVFCFAAFMGLRPGEISALKWQDIDDDWIHIRRSAWRGIVGTTKTEESVASVPLIEPVKSMLETWRQSCAGQWLFPSNRADRPLNLSQYAQRVIAPVLKKKGIQWHGLYAGRRSAATLLVQLTGNTCSDTFIRVSQADFYLSDVLVPSVADHYGAVDVPRAYGKWFSVPPVSSLFSKLRNT